MKHVGIIAEYNPFHNGHAYQLNEVKNRYPEKNILVIMSGDFVQRGEPAIFNKYLRTKCALSSGADIIFELPTLFSSASAEYFATASVLALAKTGVVDTLCFGAEDDNIDAFKRIAELLAKEPEDYCTQLKVHLKTGLSFPKARALTIASYFQDNTTEALLSKPNNILGIEYIKAIYRYHLDMEPVIIKRQGNHYHDLTLDNFLSSASALRDTIKKNNQQQFLSSDLQKFMPEASYTLLQNAEFAKPLFLSDFYTFLQYALWENKTSLEAFFEISTELANQLSAYSQYPSDIDELLLQLQNKNYTNTRIKRALLNILFKNTKQTMMISKNDGYISYLRLLGFCSYASPILKEMKQNAKLPIINKVADARNILSKENFQNFSNDIRISNLYKQAFSNKYGLSMPSEFEQSVIIQQ